MKLKSPVENYTVKLLKVHKVSLDDAFKKTRIVSHLFRTLVPHVLSLGKHIAALFRDRLGIDIKK